MTRAAARQVASGGRGWAKAPDFDDDPERLAAVHAATERDRAHYLRGGMREIECRSCHACVLVKKTSTFHTSVQWTADARERCNELERADDGGKALLPGAMMPTCPRLSASIDHGVAEGIIPPESPESDPDGYW
ncbi:MAG: hypothetical protein CME34_12770 [Gordonia sp.]|jgi:hypothetical protein|uniref:hypothetical protein n=1 Tax=Gordonia sp. (in: high G+C Gram-positive bacteria) TaxID=84139 RepID=UPI000C50E473|nr:hypothetical protein [Gordonia sp. (in: high G+C Gram-positive bacteria)]MAU82724.1 hypothetical protein [Gordonia sp. (in: high G+C Gram-positive bacteria)]MDY6809893.1 hypothetical protein [Actinomycetota bacterium]